MSFVIPLRSISSNKYHIAVLLNKNINFNVNPNAFSPPAFFSYVLISFYLLHNDSPAVIANWFKEMINSLSPSQIEINFGEIFQTTKWLGDKAETRSLLMSDMQISYTLNTKTQNVTDTIFLAGMRDWDKNWTKKTPENICTFHIHFTIS